MPKEPPNFDCRDVGQVLRLRFRDWMWPLALAFVVAIPFLGYSNGTYRIGSLTYYVNVYGSRLFFPAMAFVGLRWCLLGRLRRSHDTHCVQCNYPLDWSASAVDVERCPECGLSSSKHTKRQVSLKHLLVGVSFKRLLIDLPGLLLLLIPISLIVLLLLGTMGLIDLD